MDSGSPSECPRFPVATAPAERPGFPRRRPRSQRIAKPDVKDKRGAKAAPRFKGRIDLENVTFGYEPDRPIIENFTLNIAPQEAVALVGPTGSGKSTIISLIARFYDPAGGAVKIDGRDVREYKQRSIRDQISIVPQESVLFQRRSGRISPTASLRRAAQKS
ncbi:MAG: Xenobiotic-transporting ATPase [Bryobacterales bacterium]|nr:Xenobiotic-transporting ATPase [Bryobacterales bacterium]